MTHARKQVKNYSSVGRKGRAGKEATLRGGRDVSPGITEVADIMQLSESVEGRPTGRGHQPLAELDSARILSIEKSQAALQDEFSKVLATTAATSNAVEELKSLLTTYMGAAKGGDHGSPSVSKSVLDNLVSSSIPALEAAPAPQITGQKHMSKNVPVIVEDPPAQQKQDDTLTIPFERDVLLAAEGGEVLELLQGKAMSASERDEQPTVAGASTGAGGGRAEEELQVRESAVEDATEDVVLECGSQEEDTDIDEERELEKAEMDTMEVSADLGKQNLVDGDGASKPRRSMQAREAPTAVPHAAPNTESGAGAPKGVRSSRRTTRAAAEKAVEKKERKLKVVAAKEKKKDGRANRFSVGDEVYLINPRFVKQ